MHRVIAIAVAGVGLAGCSSFSLDSFKPTPPAVPVQLESVPPGADAVTSLGPSCKTPCQVSVPAPDAGFSVTFNMPKYLPVTIPVVVTRIPGEDSSPGSTVLDPSPVVAELKPAVPPKPARKPMRPKKPKPPPAAPAASPFPDPNAPPPPAAAPAR